MQWLSCCLPPLEEDSTDSENASDFDSDLRRPLLSSPVGQHSDYTLMKPEPLQAIRRACQQLSVQLDVADAGLHFAVLTSHPLTIYIRGFSRRAFNAFSRYFRSSNRWGSPDGNAYFFEPTTAQQSESFICRFRLRGQGTLSPLEGKLRLVSPEEDFSRNLYDSLLFHCAFGPSDWRYVEVFADVEDNVKYLSVVDNRGDAWDKKDVVSSLREKLQLASRTLHFKTTIKAPGGSHVDLEVNDVAKTLIDRGKRFRLTLPVTGSGPMFLRVFDSRREMSIANRIRKDTMEPHNSKQKVVRFKSPDFLHDLSESSGALQLRKRERWQNYREYRAAVRERWN